jgi:2'-5' RNA ligase
MGYAVALILDEPKAEDVRSAFLATDSRMLEIGASPHISLAVFDEMDVALVTRVVESFARRTPSISVRVSSIAMFPGERNVVFLAPVVTRGLLEVHESLHTALSGAGVRSDPLYVPGAWVPHCTISMEEPLDRSLATIGYLHSRDLLGEYGTGRVDVIRFRPVARLASFELVGMAMSGLA